MGQIFDTLQSLGLTSTETRQVFARNTRDRDNLTVWQDGRSKVIYIDDFFVGREEYQTGEYQRVGKPDFERLNDAERRLNDYRKFYAGKKICDVGCGAGRFLIGAKGEAETAFGVELQLDCLEHLRTSGVECSESIADFPGLFDSIFMFHSLEHFEHPLGMLKPLIEQLAPNGKLIIEVPHARDFLISTLKSEKFIEFTLWSQHLILHTRDSLRRLLEAAGMRNIVIEGRQRYTLANHLNWLSKGVPGGHKSLLSALDTPDLHAAYENSMRKLDTTDTIIAIAER
jgi:2-polyprenyl-3-methyl-5-hydroxy-6-metoxy-1,4-benzoquinol methylase